MARTKKAEKASYNSLFDFRPLKEGPLVKVLTKKYNRLREEIAEAKYAKGEAECAVDMLSDDWVLSRSKTVSVLDESSAMFRVRAISSVEREKRSNVAKAEIVRLDSVIDNANNAIEELSERAEKLLGRARYLRWRSSLKLNFDVLHDFTDYERWIFPEAELESELSKMKM